jgi:ATP-binding cassette, subfamily F, member 3
VLWLVADGAVRPFDGDLDDYRDWVLARSRRTDESAGPPAASRKAQRRAEALERQRDYAKRKPFAERLAKLEREIAALDAERKAVEAWLASPDAYVDERRDELKERLAQQADVRWRLARLEAEWLEVAEILERPEIET